jgi:hypothetical protein
MLTPTFLANISKIDLSKHFYSLSEALKVDLIDNLKGKKVLYINDHSLFSDFYLKAFSEADVNITRIECNDFRSVLKKNNYEEYILFLPVFELRIFNINYDRIIKKEYGKPYFVFIENNRSEILYDSLKNHFSGVVTNPLLQLPKLLQAYLQSAELMTWLKDTSCPHPHNDEFDRNFLLKETKKRFFLKDPRYKKSKLLGRNELTNWSLKQIHLDAHEITYQQFPIHRLYQFFFNVDLPINLLERELYGDVFF